MPRRGPYAGTAEFRASGAGTTSCRIYPFAAQVLGWYANDPDVPLEGPVLKVRGSSAITGVGSQAGGSLARDFVELRLDREWY